MMSCSRTPSSIASRVRSGSVSITRRRSSMAARRVRDIGFRPDREAIPPPPIRKGAQDHMKLGVHIGYWGLGLSAAEQLEVVREAERLGYDSVWAAEAYGSDAATILGWLAGQTTTIRIGSSIFQMP